MTGYDNNFADIRNIMFDFADTTGLSAKRNPPRRYLWTDAHAVCNFLSLYRRTGEENHKDLALMLIDQVHEVLGRHRDDDPRAGWISGLSDRDGREHPTAGGLRIGKKLGERKPAEPFDDRLEWDRDGQYFHYLTKWMHALCRAGEVSGQQKYCRWAAELAKVAHARFAMALPMIAKKRILWKMSIDLSYPLVPSSGLHDPLDAYITYNEIEGCAKKLANNTVLHDLSAEIAESAAMIDGEHLHTDDPLGLGGLLFDAGRVFQLVIAGQLNDRVFVEMLLRTANESLDFFTNQIPFSDPPECRLAFRELGLAIGLRAVESMRDADRRNRCLFGSAVMQDVEKLRKYIPLAERIEKFWSMSGNQRVKSWLDHLDINRVMLATSLLPDEFLAV